MLPNPRPVHRQTGAGMAAAGIAAAVGQPAAGGPWAGDKNPHYAQDPAILQSALQSLPGARFVHIEIPLAEPVLELCRRQRERRTAFNGPTSDLRRAGSKAQAIAAWRGTVPVPRQAESLQFLGPLLLELGYEDAASLAELQRS